MGIMEFAYKERLDKLAEGKYKQWQTEEGLLRLEAWARDGLTDEQIAHNMGICRDTLIQWKKRFPDISDTLKRGKEIVDIKVENALLKRALGYSCDNKEVPPDITAIIFWLKNRRPDKWRDKQNLEHSGEIKNNPFALLTTEQLIKLVELSEDE